MDRHIVAIGGGGFSDTGALTGIELQVADLARRDDGRLAVCYVPTAGGDQLADVELFRTAWGGTATEVSVLTLFRREVGDITELLRGQDLVFVGGGAAANLIALWHLHGVPDAMRAAYRAGVVLAGVSAGAICWHAHGITTTFSATEPTVVNGLGFVDATFCPHWQEPARHRALDAHLLRAGGVGFGCDDHGAIHYVNGRPHRELQDADGVRVAYLRVDERERIVEEPLHRGALSPDLIAP